MSYILDALRKADADRERGGVPGLHAQPAPANSNDDERGPMVGRPAWVWFAAGVSAMVLGGIAWQGLSSDSAVPAPSTRIIDSEPAPIAAPAAPQVLVEPSPSPMPTPLPTPMRAPHVDAAAAPPTPAPNAQSPGPTVTSSAGRRSDPPASAAAETRVYATNELPENIRRELPNLSVGGSIYSDSPASRFLIINGQIFHENDKVMPELTLEHIKLRAAVLRYKGYRYSITY